MNCTLRGSARGAAACLCAAAQVLTLVSCGLFTPEEPPECGSGAWVDAVARAYCARAELCWPDSDLDPSFDACVESVTEEVQGRVESEGTWYGRDPVTGSGGCVDLINCYYPLEVEESCPRPFPEWYSAECYD